MTHLVLINLFSFASWFQQWKYQLICYILNWDCSSLLVFTFIHIFNKYLLGTFGDITLNMMGTIPTPSQFMLL